MSDSDDWEKEVDDIVENKKEEVKNTKFADEEDAVDSDEEKKKVEEAKKTAVKEPARVKTKATDYDQMFEDRHKSKKPAAKPTGQTQENPKKSAKAKGEDLAK